MKRFRELLVLFALLLFVSCGNDEDSDTDVDTDTNIPPVVEILTPENNFQLVKNQQLFISVASSDADGEVDTVYIKFDGETIAQLSSLPFEFTYDTFHLNIGSTHEITAVASDNEGELTTSEIVVIEIIPPNQIEPEVQVLSQTFIGLFNIDVEIELVSPGNVGFWNIGVCWNTTGQPERDVDLNNFASGDVSETIQAIKSGHLELGTTYYFRAYVVGSLGTSYSDNEIMVQTATDFNSGTGTFTDPRDGEEYNWVTINGRTWMAENLRFTDTNNSCIAYYDNFEDTNNYGNLYRCDVCPDGWRMANRNDFLELRNYFGGNDRAGKYLKSNNPLFWDTNFATNESLFSALPGGFKVQPDLDAFENSVNDSAFFRYRNDDNINYNFVRFDGHTESMIFGDIDSSAGLVWMSLRCVQE